MPMSNTFLVVYGWNIEDCWNTKITFYLEAYSNQIVNIYLNTYNLNTNEN